MKIKGNGRNVNEIELNLKSMNTRFKCFTEPFPYAAITDLSEPNAAVIIFEDSREINSLIEMLKQFQYHNAVGIGSWK